VLLALLVVVATLQYRWLGDVSSAERERLQSSLKTRTTEFGTSLDSDVTRAYGAFEIDATRFNADPVAAISDAADLAARESVTGNAVKAIYVAEPGTESSVRRFDQAAKTLQPVAWPPELLALGKRIASAPALAIGGVPLPPGFMGDAVDGELPALVVPVVATELPLDAKPGEVVVRTLQTRTKWHAVVVWLDIDRLKADLIAPLVVRHFGDEATSDFNVAVVSRSGHRTVFRSGSADVDPKRADLQAQVFALRLGDLHWTRNVPPPPRGSVGRGNVQDRVSITIVRRGGEGADGPMPAAVTGGAWQVLVQARRGSLDAVVARSRLRNLTVSLGVLGILAASLALILIASAREQRMARQQLEFVASVSHELRTPLAVIRSAGENLADGVVSGEQVARYGALIRNEGRRLSNMVERVMDFAGMTSGTLIRSTRPTEVLPLVHAVVAELQADAADRQVDVRVRSAAHLPVVSGDADVLRSALQNVVGNAIKYSPPNGEVHVDVVATDRTLRISVEDRGLGIDADDLPHVFKPFYRGRRAVDAQIRGSGVGLSVVQKIVRAHGGEVRIAGRDAGGTVVTIELPAIHPPSAEGA
jgi:signal transduction histidine kinase